MPGPVIGAVKSKREVPNGARGQVAELVGRQNGSRVEDRRRRRALNAEVDVLSDREELARLRSVVLRAGRVDAVARGLRASLSLKAAGAGPQLARHLDISERGQ